MQKALERKLRKKWFREGPATKAGLYFVGDAEPLLVCEVGGPMVGYVWEQCRRFQGKGTSSTASIHGEKHEAIFAHEKNHQEITGNGI